MTFISYAQNFEDVMLWRALGYVEKGFYIDIGAYSPDIDSVTRSFYERGWNGINIEPNPKFLNQLNEKRSRDVNLGLAIGKSEGLINFAIVEESGLSTTNTDLIQEYHDQGKNLHVKEVPMNTLTQVWTEYVPPEQDVHFLKIDVEGNEEGVLLGIDWETCRPWVIVIEATYPMSTKEVHLQWEAMISNAGYTFAYWDGLNRFYVANRHMSLLPSFKSPPNVFDNFIVKNYSDSNTQILMELSSNISLISQRIEKIEYSNKYMPLSLNNSLHHRILFKKDGSLKKLPLNIMFNSNGKLRGIFKRIVFHKDGRPHGDFRKMFESGKQLSPGLKLKAESASEAKRGQTNLKTATANRVNGSFSLRHRVKHGMNQLGKKLVYTSSGAPRRFVWRIFFHSDGSPRRIFMSVIFKKDGSPHGEFRTWVKDRNSKFQTDGVKLYNGEIKSKHLPPIAQAYANRLRYLKEQNGKTECEL